VVADLTNSEDIVRLINETIAEFGQLDVLVNNAGGGTLSHISDTNILDNFDKTFSIDLKAALYLSHLSLSYLQKTKGTIINISSVIGLVPVMFQITAIVQMINYFLFLQIQNYSPLGH